MLTLLGTALSAILAGGATGLLGMALQRIFDWMKLKQDLALTKVKLDHELAMRDKDAAIMREEWAGRLKVAEAEGETQREVAESQAFQASLLREPERYSNVATLSHGQQWAMVILDALRGIIRPGLTLYLCALTTYIWLEVKSIIHAQQLDAAAAIGVWQDVVGTILYLFTTVTLWWFGTRNKTPQPKTR
jgi:hypothetical protein